MLLPALFSAIASFLERERRLLPSAPSLASPVSLPRRLSTKGPLTPIAEPKKESLTLGSGSANGEGGSRGEEKEEGETESSFVVIPPTNSSDGTPVTPSDFEGEESLLEAGFCESYSHPAGERSFAFSFF